jgi:hypothetical protein
MVSAALSKGHDGRLHPIGGYARVSRLGGIRARFWSKVASVKSSLFWPRAAWRPCGLRRAGPFQARLVAEGM